MLASVDRSHDRLTNLLLQLQLDIIDDGLDNHPCCLFGAVGNLSAQRHQCSYQLNVRLDGLQRLGLEQQLLEPFLLDGILLNDANDVLLEIGADIPKPFRKSRG